MSQSETVQVTRPAFREIKATPAPQRFARGWHCLGLASRFKDGKPHGVEAFGTKLVVFQDGEGELAVLNGYCLHMGADLSEGRIVDGKLACGFHDWRWSADGSCAAVPYGKRTPDERTRAWTTREVNGHLVVWHDPELNPPPADVDLPVLEGYGTDEWLDWLWCDEIIESHPRELIDNLADPAHFFYVHGQRQGGAAGYFKNVFHKHVATQYMEQGSQNVAASYPRDEIYKGAPEKIDGELRSESTWHGPAYSIDQLYWRVNGKVIHSVLFLGILPLDFGKFRLSLGVLTRRDPNLGAAENEARHAANFEMLRGATFQDIRIWQTKTRIDNPLLSETDGPIYRLREWYDQFYVDAAEVPARAVAHFAHEVDTTHANEVWNRELAEAGLL